jgi:DNA-binding GntR family transcriptional regulator
VSKAKPERYVELNRILHARVHEIAGRPRLAGIIESLRKTSASYANTSSSSVRTRIFTTRHTLSTNRSWKHSRRGKQAAKVMREHLQDTDVCHPLVGVPANDGHWLNVRLSWTGARGGRAMW